MFTGREYGDRGVNVFAYMCAGYPMFLANLLPKRNFPDRLWSVLYTFSVALERTTTRLASFLCVLVERQSGIGYRHGVDRANGGNGWKDGIGGA